MLIVEHMPVGCTKSLAEGLDRDSALTVREAKRQDTIRPGVALVAPAGSHLEVTGPGMVRPVSYTHLDVYKRQAPAAVAGDIGLLLDVPLNVSVELGRTELRIRNVLELVPGSIIELDRLAGEPIDVLVNGKHIARGEVVVIDEEFGIRITEIASQASRLQGLAD